MFARMLPVLAAALILPAAAQASSTWYVAKTGSNANGCADAAHPCLTIGAAVTKSASGDTIDIAAGTYGESVNAAGKVLTFNGAGPDASTGTIVDGHGNGTAFILSNGGTLNALRATEDSAATVTVGSPSSSHAFAVTNAVILADGFQSPIDASTSGGSLSVSITDSTLQQVQTVSGGSPQALELSGVISASVVRSTLSTLTSAAIGAGLGVDVSASDSTLTGTTGIIDSNGTLHVYRCRVTGTVDKGIYSSADTGAGGDMSTLIEDSLVRGVTAALLVRANSSGKSNNATLHDSTFFASGPGAVDGVLANAFNTATSSVTLDGSIARAISTDGGATADLHADRTGATISASYSSFSSALATLSGVVPAPGSGSNISGDPLFTDVAGGDFSLQQSSPLVDKGDQAGVVVGEKDVTGGTRVLDGNGDGIATVDVGAFEHAYVAPTQNSGGGGGGGGTTPPPPATDTTAPAFTNVKVRNGKLRFTLSEASKVTVTITRRKGSKHKRVRHFTLTGKAGANAATFKRLKPGRYRITMRATDSAGNHSKAFTRAFKVKRRRT